MCVCVCVCDACSQCYLPRGRLCLLTEPTEGRAAAERFVCEELMIDSLMAFDGER